MTDEEKKSDELRQMIITCAPSQHWSSRTPFDRNRRLWCSFAVRTEATGPWGTSNPLNFFFAGDTGLPPKFPLHQQIGDLGAVFGHCDPYQMVHRLGPDDIHGAAGGSWVWIVEVLPGPALTAVLIGARSGVVRIQMMRSVVGEIVIVCQIIVLIPLLGNNVTIRYRAGATDIVSA